MITAAPMLVMAALTLAGTAIAVHREKCAFLSTLPCPSCGRTFGVKAAETARTNYIGANRRTGDCHTRSRLTVPQVWTVTCQACDTRAAYTVETRKLRPLLSQAGEDVVTFIMLDTAFDLACVASGGGHTSAKAQLQSHFPTAALDQIAEIYLAAGRLHEVAHIVADHQFLGTLKDGEALAGLQETCRGFAPRTYVKALHHALSGPL